MRAPTANTRPHTAPSGGASSRIVEETIRTHDRLSEDEAHTRRRLAYEDCCTYCDVHCKARLSAHKHHVIQAWTSDVNANMSQQHARFDYITKQSGGQEKKRTKLIYHQYAPPGNPDLEQGFRRVPTPMSMRSRKSSASSSKSARSHDVTRKKWQMTPHHQWEVPVDDELTKRMNLISIGSRQQNNSEAAFHGSTKSQSEYAESEHDAALVKRPCSGTVRVKSSDSERIARTTISSNAERHGNTLRSCSNTLLNVYTIDDGLRHFGHKMIKPPNNDTGYEDATTKSQTRERISSATSKSTRSKTSLVKNPQTMSSILEESGECVERGSRRIKSANAQSYEMSSTACTEGLNEAVHMAFTNLENTKQVTNQTKLFKGLCHAEQPKKKSSDDQKESTRFRRLNKNLKLKIMDQYLHGSELSWKLHHRYGISRPSTSKSSSRSGTKSQDSRASRQHAQLSGRPGHHQMSQSQSLTTSRDESDTTAEHFLEMLMNMEHETLDRSTGNINIHTFLYV